MLNHEKVNRDTTKKMLMFCMLFLLPMSPMVSFSSPTLHCSATLLPFLPHLSLYMNEPQVQSYVFYFFFHTEPRKHYFKTDIRTQHSALVTERIKTPFQNFLSWIFWLGSLVCFHSQNTLTFSSSWFNIHKHPSRNEPINKHRNSIYESYVYSLGIVPSPTSTFSICFFLISDFLIDSCFDMTLHFNLFSL